MNRPNGKQLIPSIAQAGLSPNFEPMRRIYLFALTRRYH
jgi:hypothetical protein